MLSAKQRIDSAVYANQLQAANQVNALQARELHALRAQIALDTRRSKKEQVLRPVHPSIALEVEYRRRIAKLISDMNDSVLYWLKAAFKANEPEVTSLAKDSMFPLVSEATGSMPWRTRPASLTNAGLTRQGGIRSAANIEGMSGSIPESASDTASMSPLGPESEWSADPHSLRAKPGRIQAPPLAIDALPARELRRVVRKLARRWQRNFNKASEELAQWFSRRVHQRSTQTLQSILRRGGWTVDLKLTQAQRDILQATIQANVALIRSIPSQYFTQIEGMVMRSVQTGRDLKQLTNDLQRTFRVTRKRAELIARDQNNKATAATTRARQIELGLTEAIWVHSGAGKHPRPTHARNNGKRYDVRTGWWDPAVRRYIHPGTEINCRCISRSVVPGFS